MHIIVAGMIGAGKTTLSHNLAEILGYSVYEENVSNNPLLEKFYENPSDDVNRYDFLVQIFFLCTRYRALNESFSNESGVILDRSIYEDVHFANVVYDCGNLSDDEYYLYSLINKNLIRGLDFNSGKQKPDVLVYLRGSFDMILARITARGREMELQPETIKYFKKLWESYDQWLETYYSESPVLILDIEKYSALNIDDLNLIIKNLQFIVANDKTNDTYTLEDNICI